MLSGNHSLIYSGLGGLYLGGTTKRMAKLYLAVVAYLSLNVVRLFLQIPVENRQLADEGMQEEDNTYCEICGCADREDRMLLCDSCDLG